MFIDICSDLSTSQWRHNGRDSVSNHQPHDCLFNRLFRRISKTTSKLRVTGFCVVNSPETGEFPAQMTSYAEHVSIWWCHYELNKGCNWFLCNTVDHAILLPKLDYHEIRGQCVIQNILYWHIAIYGYWWRSTRFGSWVIIHHYIHKRHPTCC